MAGEEQIEELVVVNKKELEDLVEIAANAKIRGYGDDSRIPERKFAKLYKQYSDEKWKGLLYRR